MSEVKLRYKPKISLKQSIDKITVYGMWGDHDFKPRPTNRKEVATLLRSKGINPDILAEECRNYHVPVVLFERTILNRWTATPYKGGTISIVDKLTDETIYSINEPGIVSLSMYIDKFDTACEYRDRAVERNSYNEYQFAIVSGMSSIEAYLHNRVQIWNKENPKGKLLDSKDNKISLQDKLDEWIPKMTGGSKIFKGDQRWSDYLILKKIRDDVVVHPKGESLVISYNDLIKLINGFKLGIAGMLGQIHLLFRQALPNRIINAYYMPDVEIYNDIEHTG